MPISKTQNSMEILKLFARHIEDETGIVYSEHNYFQLQNRLEEVSAENGNINLEELFEQFYKKESLNIRNRIFDIATNNETSFFRDPKLFINFKEKVLPDYVKKNNGRKITIWSAACSTGQEPLSISISMLNFKNHVSSDVNYFITASDFSSRVLSYASNAIYRPLDVQRGLSQNDLERYFTKTEDNLWKANSEILKSISYCNINLRKPFHFEEKFDFVFCRNVLIYQSIENKIDIIKRLANQLKPGGFLILGSGESLLGLSKDFEACQIGESVFYRKL